MTPATVPVVTGGEPLTQHFARAGNPVCHMIPGIDITQGRVGSKLMLGTTGPQRLSDPAYKGHATIVREYIVESILTPGFYIVPGYPALAMPRWYRQKLSAAAVEKIVAYLEQLKKARPDGP